MRRNLERELLFRGWKETKMVIWEFNSWSVIQGQCLSVAQWVENLSRKTGLSGFEQEGQSIDMGLEYAVADQSNVIPSSCMVVR